MDALTFVQTMSGTAMSRAHARGRRTKSPLHTGGTSMLKVCW